MAHRTLKDEQNHGNLAALSDDDRREVTAFLLPLMHRSYTPQTLPPTPQDAYNEAFLRIAAESQGRNEHLPFERVEWLAMDEALRGWVREKLGETV